MPRADSPVVVARRHVIEFEHRVERQRDLLERLQRGKRSLRPGVSLAKLTVDTQVI
jgi:hypothetical protein